MHQLPFYLLYQCGKILKTNWKNINDKHDFIGHVQQDRIGVWVTIDNLDILFDANQVIIHKYVMAANYVENVYVIISFFLGIILSKYHCN